MMKVQSLLLFFVLNCVGIAAFPQAHTYSDPIVLGYFPSWSESWAGPGQNSKLREIPSHVNYVFLSFAKPDLVYTKGSFDISQTGIQVPYDGCTLKESVKALKDKGTYVILSVGGETYWNSSTIYNNINYQMIKDLVDDMAFVGIDWDFEPNGSFSNIGSPENVQHFIDFFNNSRALMPRNEGYVLACAPSGVGALGGQTNDDATSTHAYANRNTLTGESDANLYNSTAQTNGINLFGFSATGHMIPVIQAVGDKIDIIAYQGYNVGGSQNRKIMYDAYAYYADQYNFKVVAGVHFPEEPWGPYYTYTHSNVADLAEHVAQHPLRAGEKDGIMIWQLLMAGNGNSAYGYLNLASQVLGGSSKTAAINNANNFSMETYSGGSEVNCFCDAPQPNLGSDQNMCGQTSITLNSQVPVQSGVTFTWKKDGAVVVNSSATENSYTATGPGTYKVEVEKDGCSADDVVAIANNTPQPQLGADLSLCPDGSAELSSGVAESGYSFQWFKEGVAISSANGNSYTATEAGEYSVLVERSGCTSSSDTVLVSNDMPAFDLGAPSDLCSPATRLLQTGFSNPAYNYIWKKDGQVIDGANAASFEVQLAGTYEVTVSATGCTSQSDDVAISSSVPVGFSDTLCEAGTAELSASESVAWYDVETGGTALHNGATYSPSVAVSTDFWIGAGVSAQSFTTMRTALQGDGWQQFPYVYGTKLIVLEALTLDEVTVNAEGGSLVINIVESDGTTVVETTTLSSASGLTAVPLNFDLNPGTYFLNAVGSTSNLQVDLTPAPDYVHTGVLTVEGEAYWDWNTPYGSSYVKSGDYGNYINLKYTVGNSCDRVLVQAVIDPHNPKCNNPCTGNETYSTTELTACDSAIWNNQTYTNSGNYTWTGTNSAGCDSIATLELTIHNSTNSTQEVDACYSYTSPSGKVWVQSGTYLDTIPNAAGCDSLMEFQVTIGDEINQDLSLQACDSLVSPSGRYIWNASGSYKDTLTASSGCDSILTIQLSVYHAEQSSLDTTACDSLVSPSGKFTWFASGTYSDTLATQHGCDSVLSIQLVLHTSQIEAIDLEVCDSLVSPSGKHTWFQSGNYQDTLQAASGCDSILLITAVVHQSANSDVVMTGCDSIVSPSGKFVWYSSGDYSDTLQTTTGCDSVLTIVGVVYTSSYTTIDTTVCSAMPSPDGKELWEESGTYFDTLVSASGCDSILEFELQLISIDTVVGVIGGLLKAQSPVGDFQWLNCENDFAFIPGENQSEYDPDKTGSFAVEITDGVCRDTSGCHPVTISSIAGVEQYMNFTIQTVESGLKVVWKGSVQEIAVYGLSGKVYFQTPLRSGQMEIVIPGLPSDLVIVQLKSDGQVLRRKWWN